MSQLLIDNAKNYKHGFVTAIESESLAKGLTEETIRWISAKKEEPAWLTEFRLKAFAKWQSMHQPTWADLDIEPIDYQNISYFTAPKKNSGEVKSLNDLDPELLKTFERLGIPLQEQKRLSGVAVDAVFDSVSLGTTHTEILKEHGVVFCSFSEAVHTHPDLIKKYLASVVPVSDNYFAALNSAVFSDGSFCYIPEGVKCPLDLSTYFRINARESGQFERTLLIADRGSFVNYLEGCTAPMYDSNQLHAAVVELVALEGATINYSTVQNWYAGDAEGRGGVYNFVTKRGKCLGAESTITWTQVEAGSAITWKYPSVILQGDRSTGAFYSVALTHDYMQADTGTKMIHIGRGTTSTIISKGIATDQSRSTYRGLVHIHDRATGSRNYTQCDSMLVGPLASANTYPDIKVQNLTSTVEHEATTVQLSADQLFYLGSRGFSSEQAISMMVNGFCAEVFRHLPLEFATEAVQLIEMKLENSVG